MRSVTLEYASWQKQESASTGGRRELTLKAVVRPPHINYSMNTLTLNYTLILNTHTHRGIHTYK